MPGQAIELHRLPDRHIRIPGDRHRDHIATGGVQRQQLDLPQRQARFPIHLWLACIERQPLFGCPSANERHPRCVNPQFHRNVLSVVVVRPLGRPLSSSGQSGHSEGIGATKWAEQADKLDIQLARSTMQPGVAGTEFCVGTIVTGVIR
jgi:hypothetical protein